MTCPDCLAAESKLCPKHAAVSNHDDAVDMALDELRGNCNVMRHALERIASLGEPFAREVARDTLKLVGG